MTRDQFTEKWEARLMRLGLYGLALDTEDRAKGPSTAEAKALKFIRTIPQLLGELWDSAQPAPVDAPVNGKHPAPTRR